MKLFFLSAQLQGLRLVDTFPWIFIFFGKIKKNFTKTDLIISLIYLSYIIYGLFISTNNESFLKVSAFITLSFLASRIAVENYSNINSKNFYIIILIGVIIEDILANNFGIKSPFVRDPNGAFFLFREKSYFSLIFFSLVSFSKNFKSFYFFYLFLIGLFVNSGLFWVLYIGLFVYKFLRKYSENFINYCFLIISTLVYVSLNSVENIGSFLLYVNYTDLLRVLINLTSLNSSCVGTFFLQDCTQEKIIIDLSTSYYANWENITGQSTFFLIYNFFGIPGIFFIVFYLVLILKKIKFHKNRGFIFFNILIQIFLQGFLLSPIYFWVLALRDQKPPEK